MRTFLTIQWMYCYSTVWSYLLYSKQGKSGLHIPIWNRPNQLLRQQKLKKPSSQQVNMF